MQNEYHIQQIEDWNILAKDLKEVIVDGSIIALSGPLGAGKTTFVQALARILGAEVNPRSPTFSLMRTYPLKNNHGITRLIHVDAYRLEKPSDVLSLNLEEELMEPGTILVIEWPQNMPSWLALYQDKIISLEIDLKSDDSRFVRIQ